MEEKVKHSHSNSHPEFTHLLLTRFNLDYSPETGQPYRCDEEWHRQRFDLFFTYCVPSIQHQTCNRFTWLIFFNMQVKDLYQKEIERTEREVPQARFVYVAPGEDHIKQLKEFLRSEVKTGIAATSRFDNDDVISHNYIEKVQASIRQEAGRQRPYLVNAGTGYQAEVGWPYRIGLVRGRSYSSFITLVGDVEKSAETVTVLDVEHQAWKNRINSVELTEHPAWIQVIHNRNLANAVKTTRLCTGINPEQFSHYQHPVSRFGMKMLYPFQFLISMKNKVW